jgi:putative FmdB family regulatory protein
MPIYEYECKSCHHAYDLIEKMSDEPNKHCPACNQDTAVRLVSAAGFQLKGTGWYATDFKDKTSTDKKKSTKTDSKDTASSPEIKSSGEAKPKTVDKD